MGTMDQGISTFDYPVSTTQSSTIVQNEPVIQSILEPWDVGSYYDTMQDQMEWLTPAYAHLGPDYPTGLPNMYSNPSLSDSQHSDSTPRLQPRVQLMPKPMYPSLMLQALSSPISTQQASDGIVPADNSSDLRPESACTMLDSGSSNQSRQSSISTSPRNRQPKFLVPSIRTHFDNHGQATGFDGTPMVDGIQVADTENMSAMSNEWMQVHDTSDQHGLHDSVMSGVNMKTSPALLEPFQWQSPMSRRTSMSSSAVSGSVFSPHNTPTSALWHQSSSNSPYGQPRSFTPISATSRFSISPHSPNYQRNYKSWSRGQYNQALRQNKQLNASSSLPSRNKPRLIRHVTDSFAQMPGTLPSQSRIRSSENKRARAESTSHPYSGTPQQMSLPEFQLSALFVPPQVPHTDYGGLNEVHTPPRNILPSSTVHTPMAPPQSTPRANLTPGFNSLHIRTPCVRSEAFPTLPTNMPICSSISSIPTPAHQPPLPTPSEPPPSDFQIQTMASNGSSSPSHDHVSACGPIRQSPHFEGDIYTPRFKRRNASGKWEGWCGYCQPGRWLDLKNSRYWEDKLRNHGICARTKTFFDGPLRVRWISDRGTIWDGEAGDSGFDGKEGFDDDGVGRKREGLCGECDSWILMDGQRTRGKGRCVAWWMHAYKCHEQSKSRTDGA